MSRYDVLPSRAHFGILANDFLQRWQTLRIWISNTAEDQVWQGNDLDVNSFDFSTNLEPTYRVKIEGRLLDDDDDLDNEDEPTNTDSDAMEVEQAASIKGKRVQKYRLSHFFKALTVDFPANRKGMDTAVEWKKPERNGQTSNLPPAADFDEFTFKRSGDDSMNVTINLFRHEEPERYALSPELEAIVDLSEATRQEVVMGLWEYIKMLDLQEDEEKRNFRCDELLRKVCCSTLLIWAPRRLTVIYQRLLASRWVQSLSSTITSRHTYEHCLLFSSCTRYG